MTELKSSDTLNLIEEIKKLFPEFSDSHKTKQLPKFPFSLGPSEFNLSSAVLGKSLEFLNNLVKSLKLKKELESAFKSAFGKNPSLLLLKLYAVVVLKMEIDVTELKTNLVYPTYVNGIKTMVETNSVMELVSEKISVSDILSFLPKEHSSYSNLVQQFFNLKPTSKKNQYVKEESKGDNEEAILEILKKIPLPPSFYWSTSLFINGKVPSGVTSEFDICLVGSDNIVYLIIECKRTISPIHPEKHRNGHELAKVNGLMTKDGKEKFTVSKDLHRIFITESFENNISLYKTKYGSLFKNPSYVELFSISHYGALLITKNPEEKQDVPQLIEEYKGEVILQYKP
jgi:hypothetical protein